MLGYVDTNFACTSTTNLPTTLSNVKTGLYGVSTWYSSYPSQVQGIFFDEGPMIVGNCHSGDLNGLPPQPESTQQSYYSQAYSYVGTSHSGATVMLNASQFEHSWIMSGTYKSADYAVIFERDYNTWYNTYKAEDGSSPSWWTSGYSGQLTNTIYNTTQYDISTGVSHSQTSTYGSPVLYFFDGDSTAYNHLSCSFETQVALLQNTTPVPAATTYCGGTCTDLNSDKYNCGSCATDCTQTGICPFGYCSAGGCTTQNCTNAENNICNRLGLLCDPCTHQCS